MENPHFVVLLLTFQNQWDGQNDQELMHSQHKSALSCFFLLAKKVVGVICWILYLFICMFFVWSNGYLTRRMSDHPCWDLPSWPEHSRLNSLTFFSFKVWWTLSTKVLSRVFSFLLKRRSESSTICFWGYGSVFVKMDPFFGKVNQFWRNKSVFWENCSLLFFSPC